MSTIIVKKVLNVQIIREYTYSVQNDKIMLHKFRNSVSSHFFERVNKIRVTK